MGQCGASGHTKIKDGSSAAPQLAAPAVIVTPNPVAQRYVSNNNANVLPHNTVTNEGVHPMHKMASNNSITFPIAGPTSLSSNYFQPVPVYTPSNHRSNRSRSTSEIRSESSPNHQTARRKKKKKRRNHHDQDIINDMKQDPSQRKHKKKKKKRRNHRSQNYRARSHSNSYSDTPGMDRHISNQGVQRQNSFRPGQHQSNSNNFYHNPSGRSATTCSVSIERSNSFAPQLVQLPKPPNSLNKIIVKREDCMSSISSQGTTRAAAIGASQSPFFEVPHSSSLQLFE